MITAFSPGQKFIVDYTIDERVYNGFLSVFNDNNPLHTNRDFAIQKGFHAEVMHGNILNGFISNLVGEHLPLKNVIIHTQQIQFNLPVYLHDRLLLDAEVSDVIDSVQAVVLKIKFTNQFQKKVASAKVQIGILP